MSSTDFPSSSSSVTHSGGQGGDGPPDLRILHYNDVYHLQESSSHPCGGVSRFQTVCNYYRNDTSFQGQPDLLTFFSGDAFNPSLESSVTKGRHMVPVLNAIGTDVACVGNHDLDFGVPQFRHLTDQCTFPWLLANVLDPDLGEDVPLGNAKKTLILTSSNGIKVGVIGLVEREWLDTINSLPPNLVYKSASATAKELVPELRKQGAELIIAVSHQREPNDNKLAENTPDGLIDIVLGGHDHYYQHKIINSTHILRSGTDFKQLSYIEARKTNSGKWDFNITRRDISSDIPVDHDMTKLVDKLIGGLSGKLDRPIGYSVAPLDARFSTVRLAESNYGNFVCDVMRSYYSGDCAIMAAGTVRGDQIYPPGVIKLKDLMSCFPFEDPVVVIKVTGQAIVEALENGVSKVPALEGRFPQVSNIHFEFDPKAKAGSRVKWTKIGGEAVDLAKKYVLVTRGYMVKGKDGFSSLLIEEEGGTAEEVVSEENGVLISTILRQYFMSLKVLGRWKQWNPNMRTQFDRMQTELTRVHTFHEPDKDAGEERSLTQEDVSDSDSEVEQKPAPKARRGSSDRELMIMRKTMKKWRRLAGLKGSPAVCGDEELQVNWTKGIAPRLEDRIIQTES